MALTEPPRPPRADAQRNRQKLLAAALEAFAAQGTDASLEGIARQAGVGIGTLYRHFPTREALALEAYRYELEQLCEAAPELLHRLPPDEALREWMAHFSRYIVSKRGLSAVLKAALTDPQPFYAELGVRERVTAALNTLLRPGMAEGLIRDDADTELVLLALIGIWQISAEATPAQVTRLLDLLVDGLRASSR